MSVFEGIGTAAAGGILGLALQGVNDSRQMNQQQRLQNMQIEGQKQMAIFNREQAMQMWHDTNYDAQRKEMEKAGLNVGLMYGQGGGGGTTANVAPGNVTGGQAPSGGGEIGMGIQTGMQMASMELMKAQAEKAKAEAQKISGVDTELANTQITQVMGDTEKKAAESQLIKANTAMQSMQNYEQLATQEARIQHIQTESAKAKEELTIAKNEAKISDGSWNAAIERINAEAIGATLDNMLTEAKISMTKEQTRAIGVDLAQEWERLTMTHEGNVIDAQRNKIMWVLGKMNLKQREREMMADAITNVLNTKNANEQRSLDRTERSAQQEMNRETYRRSNR